MILHPYLVTYNNLANLGLSQEKLCVNLLKSKINHCKCTECPRKLCKTYLKYIGYV